MGSSDNPTDENTRTSSRVTRRRALALTSATLAGVAGCSGNGSNTPTQGGDGSGGDGSDGSGGDGGDGGDGTGGDGGGTPTATEVATGGTPVRNEAIIRSGVRFPQDRQYNPFNFDTYVDDITSMVYDVFSFYDRASTQFYPFIVKSWDMPDQPSEGDTLSVQLRDENPATWTNGDPVRARDIATRVELEYFEQSGLSDFLTDWEMTGEFSIDFTIGTEILPQLLFNELAFLGFKGTVNVKHELYQSELESLQDASTQEEEDQIVQNLVSRRIDYDEAEFNGPYEVVNETAQDYVLERRDDYVSPAQIDGFEIPEAATRVEYEPFPNVERIRMRAAENQQVLPMLQGTQIDATGITASTAPSQVPSDPYSVVPAAMDIGYCLGFNLGREPYSNRTVRHALANIIDRDRLVEIVVSAQQTDEFIQQTKQDNVTVMTDPAAKRWLGDAYDQMPKYNNGENSDQKIQRGFDQLREAGFTRENGTWHLPSGEVWRPEIMTSLGWDTWFQPLVSYLQEQGIQAQFRNAESTAFWNNLNNVQDFDMTGMIYRPCFDCPMIHPWEAYDFELGFYQAGTDGATYQVPEQTQIPNEIGNPDSEMETVNILDLISQLRTPQSEESMQQTINKAAWLYTQLLPSIPLAHIVPQLVVNDSDFVWPENPTNFSDYRLMQDMWKYNGTRSKWQ